MSQPDGIPLPLQVQRSISILRDALDRAEKGEVWELAIVMFTPDGSLLTAYSETDCVFRMGGALVQCGIARMGFKETEV